MPFLKVSSSQIHSWQYDAVEQLLSTRFNCKPCDGSGEAGEGTCGKCRGEGHTGVYHHQGVDSNKWAALRDAPSKGKAFHELIKKAGHKFTFVPNGASA